MWDGIVLLDLSHYSKGNSWLKSNMNAFKLGGVFSWLFYGVTIIS